ncbi:hypothetical protein SAMN05216551_105116 [Chitinasiproducens palmae]|uniref:Uncharacterized protein n=1 Tax=Chitinasiproducens palmae TaxID=1770053 RepID=A0A1H2PR12_9BURK|nr:hypothetical protein SAMN05216551_105116 [Chitinasiproducens palmae]
MCAAPVRDDRAQASLNGRLAPHRRRPRAGTTVASLPPAGNTDVGSVFPAPLLRRRRLPTRAGLPAASAAVIAAVLAAVVEPSKPIEPDSLPRCQAGGGRRGSVIMNVVPSVMLE